MVINSLVVFQTWGRVKGNEVRASNVTSERWASEVCESDVCEMWCTFKFCCRLQTQNESQTAEIMKIENEKNQVIMKLNELQEKHEECVKSETVERWVIININNDLYIHMQTITI